MIGDIDITPSISNSLQFEQYLLTITEEEGQHTLTVSKDGIVQTMVILDGAQGAAGPQGATGPQGVSVTRAWLDESKELELALSSGITLHVAGGSLKGPKGDKGDPGEGVEIDPTLTGEGDAAEAKATGEAIAEVADDLETLSGTVSGHVSDEDAHMTRAEKIIFAGKYKKPDSGIPSTDMTAAVQTSLDKAESAYQKPGTGIPSADLASAVQTLLDKADNSVQTGFVTVQTTAPTAAETDGGVHIAVLDAEPETKYDGYIYMIKEA